MVLALAVVAAFFVLPELGGGVAVLKLLAVDDIIGNADVEL